MRILSNDFEALRVCRRPHAGMRLRCASRSPPTRPPNTRTSRCRRCTINPAEYTRRRGRQQFDRAAAQRRPDPSARRPRRQVRPGPAAQPADQDRRQGHGDRLHGQLASTCSTARTSSTRPALQPPKTYDDVLAAAKAIKDKGLMEYPLAASDEARLGSRRRIRQHLPGHRRRVLRSPARPSWRSTTRTASRRSRP